MLYFKDVITEIKVMFMEVLKTKNDPMLCPNCGEAKLKRNSVLEHMIEVAVSKFTGSAGAGAVTAPAYGAGTPAGGAVPAPDHWFMCPNCLRIFIMVDDIITGGSKFVNINIFDRIFSLGEGKKDKQKGGKNGSRNTSARRSQTTPLQGGSSRRQAASGRSSSQQEEDDDEESYA